VAVTPSSFTLRMDVHRGTQVPAKNAKGRTIGVHPF
jgi:hypothetical protein